VLDLVDEGADMGKQLDSELIASLDKLLGSLGCANSGRGTGQDNCAGGQGGALGEEADQLRHAEDQVTEGSDISVDLVNFDIRPHMESLREGTVLHDAAALEATDLKLASVGDESSGDENGTWKAISMILPIGTQQIGTPAE
jgi:hypothetical protein